MTWRQNLWATTHCEIVLFPAPEGSHDRAFDVSHSVSAGRDYGDIAANRQISFPTRHAKFRRSKKVACATILVSDPALPIRLLGRDICIGDQE
jgi:hypothetical protein